MKSINIFPLDLPVKRPFRWRVLFALVVLYFLANLAGIPLLRKTDAPIEPVGLWVGVTAISALVIAVSMAMANRVSLGAPLLEGRISKKDLPAWLGSGLALTLLILVVGLPLALVVNLDVDPATYAFGWELLPASFKAGVVEEVGYRFLVVSLLVWVGGFFGRDEEGRPHRSVYWLAILLSGLLFGWAHVAPKLGYPSATFWDYALVMGVNAILGICFGWLFWKLGLEWAMFAHFAFDAFASMVVVPIYLLKSPIAWLVLLVVLAATSILLVRFLLRGKRDA